jgi:hypothetical protein
MAENDFENLKNSIEGLKTPIDKILESIGDMYQGAENLNNAFLQGRTRMDEMADAVARSAAGVIRLGGSIEQVSSTMADIARGSERNVLATEEQVSKLFAASQIIGKDTETIVRNFAQAGVEASQIGTNLEQSIEYVQSVGLNAQVVMGEVTDNMALMNQFSFADGVAGLTKMAAQASMLRFDMQNTANFANKVMGPEGAIEAAAGFQRLGVSIGNLTDPFALMNQSLTDPGALQDSIINATKQFTEFDEKTKTFKINPQGILMLKEMADVTGISAAELSKTALAAADLDKRLSAISPSISFENEEDKKLLANMATMGKEGEYVVQIKDDKGNIEQKKLADLTQEEFEKLREQQENRPKTLEDIQISQLDVLKNIQSSLDANIAKGTFGVAATPVIRGNLTGAERISRAIVSSIDKAIPESAVITEKVTDAVDKMSSLFMAKDAGKISEQDFSKQVQALEESIMNQASSMGQVGMDALKDLLQDANKKITGTSGIEKEFKNFINETLDATGVKTNAAANAVKEKAQVKPLSESDILGQSIQSKVAAKQIESKQSNNYNVKNDVTGNIKITIDGSVGANGLTQQQLTQIFNSDSFKQYVANLGKDTKGSGVVTYQ